MLSLLGKKISVPACTMLTRGTNSLLTWSTVARVPARTAGAPPPTGSAYTTASGTGAPCGSRIVSVRSPDVAGIATSRRVSAVSVRIILELDHVALHRREDLEQFVTRRQWNLLRAHGVAQHFHEFVELRIGDLVAGVHVPHGVARVGAAAAGQRADLFGK